MRYTPEEYTDMIVAYGLARENARSAARIYAERFPGRRHPSGRTIVRVVQQLRETGCLMHNAGAGGPAIIDVRDEERILQEFYENPGTSVRRAARELQVARCAVQRVLRRNELHPYHFQRVQLLPRDLQPRINFCGGIIIINFLYSRYFTIYTNHR